jgi:hypothetical protein
MVLRRKSSMPLSTWFAAALIGMVCLFGGATKAQTRAASKASLCEFDDGGIQALCEIGSRSMPSGTNDYLPALDEFAIALSVYSGSRGAGGTRPELSQLREHLVVALPELKSRVDTLIEHSQAKEDETQFREQLIQVLLCPYVLDHGLAPTQKVCGDAGPTPAELTRRLDIIQAVNAYYAAKNSNQPCTTPTADPVCIETESRPLEVYDILRDWLLALEAEAHRQKRCQSADPAECALALLDAAQTTAAALTADQLLAQWLPGGGAPDTTRCLTSLAATVPGTGSSINLEKGAAKPLPDVISLWASPDQTARRELETRLSEWRAKGHALANGPHAIAQLPDACLHRAVSEVVAAVSGVRPTPFSDAPRFDAAGHIVAVPFSSDHGFHDFASQGDGPLAALRVRFPALPARECPPDGVVGALSLIGRFRDPANAWQSLEFAVGVEEIHFTALCQGSLAFSRHQISPEQLRQALGKMLPPPLRLADATAKLNFLPSPSGPGSLTLTVTAHVGIVGSNDAEKVTWDIGTGGTSLDAAVLIATVKPILERRLAPVLGDAVSKAGLYLTLPKGCGGDGESSQAHGIRLYACLRLPSRMGLPNNLPAVLTTIDFDPQGRLQIVPSHDSVAAVQDALTKALAEQVGEWSSKLGVNQTILNRFHAEPSADGLRLQLALRLGIGGTTVPWPLTLDVPYRGGKSLEDQFLDQLPSAKDLAKLARDTADKAVLQAIDDALARLELPGIRIKERDIAGRRLLLELNMPIPGFEHLCVPVDLHNPDNIDSALKSVLRQKMTEALSAMPEIALAGITMTQTHLLKDRWALASIAILYKSVTVGVIVPLDGRFIPVVDRSTISNPAVTAMLNGVLGDSIKKLTGGVLHVDFELIDGLPTLRISGGVDLTLLGPLSMAGKLNARVSQRDGLTVERLRLECKGACWVTLGEFQIGDFSIAVDLPRPKNFAIGAKLALTPGAETEKLLRLQAELTVGDPIRVDGSLQLLRSANLGTFTGVLDPAGERMDLQGALQLPVLEIPLGSAEVELDGKRCVLLGRGSQNFLGIGGVSIDTQLRFARCKGSELSGVPMTPPTTGICHVVERSDVSVCAAGFGNVLKQRVGLSGAMSLLPLRAPLVLTKINILDIDLDTEIRRNMVRLRGSLGGVAKITLLLPTLSTLNPEDVKRLLSQLLKPKLDWDAIRRRDITVSLIPSSSSQEHDDDSEASEQASSANDSMARQAISTASHALIPSPPPPARGVPVSTTSQGGGGPSLDCSTNRLYEAAGAGPRWWGISSGICALKQRLLLDASQLVFGSTSLAIFCEQEGVGCKGNKIYVTAATEGKDASATLTRPIDLPDDVVAVIGKPWSYQGTNNLVGLLFALASAPSSKPTLSPKCLFRDAGPGGACNFAVAITQVSATAFAWGTQFDIDQSSLLWMVLNLDPARLRIPTNLESIAGSTTDVSLAGSDGKSIFLLPGKVIGRSRNILRLKRLSLDSQGALRLEDTLISATFSSARLPVTASNGGWLIGRIASERKLVAYLGETIKKEATCSISLQGISYCRFTSDAPGLAYAYVRDSARNTIVERSESCLHHDMDFWIHNDMQILPAPSLDYWSQSPEFLSRIQRVADEWANSSADRTRTSFRSNPRLLVTNPLTPCEAKL